MKINKYYPFAFVYFFLNSLWLPFGMLYTIILTPLFYVWLQIKRKKLILLKFIVFSTPFMLFHLINGVDAFYYFRSVILFLTVYIFSYAFYTFITIYKDLDKIFEKLLNANFIFTIIALLLVFTQYRPWFWQRAHWSTEAAFTNLEDWPRLAMLTYEPSYYATLLVPIFAYYFSKFILGQIEKRAFVIMLMITLPIVLSISLGVIGALVAAVCILIFFNIPRFLKRKRLLYPFLIVVITGVVTFVFLLIFYNDNPLFTRFLAFVSGDDQSGRGRTTEAFYLAHTIAGLKSYWWGIGPGQIKIIGDSVIRTFYNYPADWVQVGIPNAFAETIGLFGYVGAFIRLFVEVYLFYKTKVLSNYYRTFMFFYIFVYQFTGSFTTNIAEYVIWILAFTNVFPQFDKYPNAKLVKAK